MVTVKVCFEVFCGKAGLGATDTLTAADLEESKEGSWEIGPNSARTLMNAVKKNCRVECWGCDESGTDVQASKE